MTRKTDTTIPGLTVEFKKRSSWHYAVVLHVASGKRVCQFTSKPLAVGKRAFCKAVDDSRLTQIDWTQDEKTLATKEFYDIVTLSRVEDFRNV